MKLSLFILLLLGVNGLMAQSNTLTSGNWTDPSVWSTGVVPPGTATVNVNHALTVDQSISVTTGTYTFNANATDLPGGTKYKLNISGGAIDIFGVVTFEGGTAAPPGGNNNQFDGGVVTVKAGGILILGHTQLQNNVQVIVDAGGTLIINGDLINKANTGVLSVAGAVYINGNYDGQTGSTTVSGAGTFETTGTMSSNGTSTIFGSTNPCTAGPCSGTNLTCTFTNTVSPTSKVVCFNTSPGTLTATTSAGTPTYQWKSSTDGATYANASGTSTNSTYAVPNLTVNTWYRVEVTSNSGGGSPCTSTSAATKITVLPNGGGWIGATSTSWGTATNWCGGAIPISTTDVVITNSAGLPNLPVILAGTTAACNNLTISLTFPATSLTLNANGTLRISGNLTNDGTFTDNTSVATNGVHLVGSSVQSVGGVSPISFSNLTVINTSGATPAVNIGSNNLTVRTNLTMSTGNVNLNGYTLTLGTATGAATRGILLYPSVTGSRFYAGNLNRWFPSTAIAIGNVAGLFPIGTSADYRPLYEENTGLSAGGTIKVSHTGSAAGTDYGTPFLDAGFNVTRRSDAYWSVTTGNSLGTGTHSIRTDATGFVVNNINDVRIALVNGIAPGAHDPTPGGTPANPQIRRTGLTTANLTNNFYWGTIDKVNSPLPLTLIAFEALSGNEGTELRWVTESEKDFDYFSIERSVDGMDFQPIGEVKGEGLTHRTSYRFVVTEFFSGTSYYRLKMVDTDNSFRYSKIVLVGKDLSHWVSVYPNPASRTLNLDIFDEPGSEKQFIMQDAFGRIFLSQKIDHARNMLTLPETIVPGLYIIRIYAGSKQEAIRIVIR